MNAIGFGKGRERPLAPLGGERVGVRGVVQQILIFRRIHRHESENTAPLTPALPPPGGARELTLCLRTAFRHNNLMRLP